MTMTASGKLFFFCHLPKTAGTTLNRVLEANIPAERVLSVYDKAGLVRLDDLDMDALESLDLIQGHVYVPDWNVLFNCPRPLSIFTFLREPVARVVSEYRFLRSWPGQHLYEFMNRERISLAEYVSGSRRKLAWRGRNSVAHLLSGVDPNREPDKALDTAMSNLTEKFAMFGLAERFDESLLMLRDLMGLENIFYERQNVAAPAKEFDAVELEAVAEANQVDAELYRRASAVFNERVQALGPGFARETAWFEKVNAKFQKVSNLLLQRAGHDPDKLKRGK